MPETKKKAYRYDPENMFSVVQEGGSSSERYVHLFDSPQAAERYRKDAAKHTYDTDEPTTHPRPGLERAAPLMFEMLRWLHETGVLDAGAAVGKEIEALLAEARTTENLDDIVEQARKWWIKRGKPFMGENQG